MKKLLVVLLALTFVFAFATTAMAADEQIADYTDVTAENEYGAAIMRLTSLGVLVGDGIGEAYRPDDSLTRAEFAKIAVYLTNNEDKYDYYNMMASQFTDVAAGFWGKGWINAADDLGLMIGRGNGTFDPYAKVSYQEVATVVLRALGYDDNLPGDWPYDYNTKAGEVGIVKWVNYTSPSSPISRGEMASIANEALDEYMVSYVKNDIAQGLGYVFGEVDKDGYAPFIDYTNESTGTRYAGEYTSLLEYAFDAVMVEAWFNDDEIAYSEATAWGYDDFDEGEIDLYYAYWNTKDKEWDAGEQVGLASQYYIWQAGLIDLGGQRAELTLVDDEIVFAEITSDIVRARDVAMSGKKIEADDVKYDDGIGTTMIGDAIDNYGELFLDDSEAYDYKDYTRFEDDTFRVFDFVDEYFVEDHLGRNIRLKSLDDYVIFKDGEQVAWEDLKEGDVIYETTLADNETTLYLAYAPTTGDLTKHSYTNEELTIDEIVYTYGENNPEYAPTYYSQAGVDDLKQYDGEDLSDDFFDNDITYAEAYGYNEVAYFCVDTIDSRYAVVTDYIFGSTSWHNDVVGFELFTGEGETIEVELNDSIDFFDRNERPTIGSLISYEMDGEEIDTDSIEYRYAGDAATADDFRDAPYQVSCFLSDIRDPQFEVTTDADEMELTFANETYKVSSSTVIFSVIVDEVMVDQVPALEYSKVRLVTAEDLMKDDSFTVNQIAVGYGDYQGIDVLWLVGYEQAERVIGFVTEYWEGNPDQIELNGDENYVLEDAYDDLVAAPEEGDFVQLVLNADDEVVDINIIATEAGLDAAYRKGDEITAGGKTYQVSTGLFQEMQRTYPIIENTSLGNKKTFEDYTAEGYVADMTDNAKSLDLYDEDVFPVDTTVFVVVEANDNNLYYVGKMQQPDPVENYIISYNWGGYEINGGGNPPADKDFTNRDNDVTLDTSAIQENITVNDVVLDFYGWKIGNTIYQAGDQVPVNTLIAAADASHVVTASAVWGVEVTATFTSTSADGVTATSELTDATVMIGDEQMKATSVGGGAGYDDTTGVWVFTQTFTFPLDEQVLVKVDADEAQIITPANGMLNVYPVDGDTITINAL